jgi:hypothetical protein
MAPAGGRGLLMTLGSPQLVQNRGHVGRSVQGIQQHHSRDEFAEAAGKRPLPSLERFWTPSNLLAKFCGGGSVEGRHPAQQRVDEYPEPVDHTPFGRWKASELLGRRVLEGGHRYLHLAELVGEVEMADGREFVSSKARPVALLDDHVVGGKRQFYETQVERDFQRLSDSDRQFEQSTRLESWCRLGEIRQGISLDRLRGEKQTTVIAEVAGVHGKEEPRQIWGRSASERGTLESIQQAPVVSPELVEDLDGHRALGIDFFGLVGRGERPDFEDTSQAVRT